MAEKANANEREYVIPLRREYLKVPQYRRAGRAVKAIKKFIAKHMKVADRNVDNVKIDMYFNNEVWMRGKTNPPSKVKVKATRDGDVVRVTFVEVPKRVEFQKAKNERMHLPAAAPAVAPKEDKKEEKTEEQKVEEKEKGAAVAEAGHTAAKQDAKAAKHVTKADKAARPQRMALQK